MKDAIGISAILLIGVVLYLVSIPGYNPTRYNHLCPDSKPIIIDGAFSGVCTNYQYDYVPMWIPKTGPAKLQECKYCESLG